ncbi:MAG TPA: Dyp-type peroxidase [Solirubrobacteraceae bacterium]
MQGPDPQPVLTPITAAAIFLVLTVDAGAEDAIRELLADLSGLKRSVGFRVPEAELTCIAGVGALLWDRLFERRPAGLHPFPQVTGARHVAVSTAGDLLFHIRAHRFDMCFELAQLLTARLEGIGRVVDEVHGFKSFDERDLLGFVDGTENPEGSTAQASVLIGEEDPLFAGGSYVIVQKYLHDLAAWNALATEQQEAAIGRRKLNDVELPDDQKPANSHVALNTIIDDDGRQRQIVRANMPFGSVGSGEFGTYFIGYARDPDVTEQMLRNMFIGDPPGNHDRVLDFSTAVTGNLFFVPSAAFLDDPAEAMRAAEESAAEPGRAAQSDGSLGIGGLRPLT